MENKLLFETKIDMVPPPKTNSYLSSKSGKRFIPQDISCKIDKIVLLLKSEKQLKKLKTIENYVLLDVLFVLPSRRIKDLDNMVKTLGDCLQKAEIIKNDNLIAKTVMEKAFFRKNSRIKNKEGITHIKIYQHKLREL